MEHIILPKHTRYTNDNLPITWPRGQNYHYHKLSMCLKFIDIIIPMPSKRGKHALGKHA